MRLGFTKKRKLRVARLGNSYRESNDENKNLLLLLLLLFGT